MGWREAESPGWFDALPKSSSWDMMHEWARCHDKAGNHQLPIASAFWIIGIVSEGGMFKLNAEFDEDSLLCLLSHFECDGHTVHMLTQGCLPPQLTSTVWCCHCPCMHIPVHSPWLPRYLDIMQTILVILTMVGLFADKPCTHIK